MTITITKHGAGRATITVDGRSYGAVFHPANRNWSVVTDQGEQFTTSPKVNSLARIFAKVQVAGAKPSKPRAQRAPRAPRAPRVPGAGRRSKKGPIFAAPKPDARSLLLVMLSTGEDALVAALAAPGAVTPAKVAQFEKYKKLKALALGSAQGTAAANEAFAALRLAYIELVKLVF